MSRNFDKPFVACIPMNIDAFILNTAVCEKGRSRISPVTQPDYQGLRPVKGEIRPDILPHVDVTGCQPASINSRITATEATNPAVLDPTRPERDVTATPILRENRIGVYVHWSLPRLYRAATGGAEGISRAVPNDELVGNENQSSNFEFRPVPNRWLVMRNIKSSVPDAPAAEKNKSWIVDSDRLWNVDELGTDIDLETDVSPYVSLDNEDSEDLLNRQAGVYIGSKVLAKDWSETQQSTNRVRLTVMNSSNFCFADNAMHNPNVFSIIDNFQYIDDDGQTVYSEKVTCDYTILGWHSKPEDDPLGQKNGVRGALDARLHALFLSPPYEIPRNVRIFGTTICHGTIYNVEYTRGTKPPTPADTFADLFTPEIKMEPVAIGTTGLDAVLSFLKAHEDEEDEIFGTGTNSVAKSILGLSQLLYAAEDDYDQRVKASDLIYSQNFAPSEGGRAWHFDGRASKGGAPAQPRKFPVSPFPVSEVELLRRVNDLQNQADAAKRKLKQTRWSLFSVWWMFVSDPNNDGPDRIAIYQNLVGKYRTEARNLITLLADPGNGLERQIENIVGGPGALPQVKARSIPQPEFFQRRDPAICIAGMDSGWPFQYLGYVPVRFLWDLPITASQDWLEGGIAGASIAEVLQMLLAEAIEIVDHGTLLGFKKWTTQPWCSLYIEWEATYFHIPIEKWSIDILNSPIGNNHTQVRYGVKKALSDDPESASDQRTVGGRVILLPQTSVNLQALVDQVSTDPGVTLTKPELDNLRTNISKLKFTTAELSGITTNLLTLSEGTHVQPNIQPPGQSHSKPLPAAIIAGQGAGFTLEDYDLIATESALSPYGSLVDFSDAANSPFKGVTHGQLLFSKLNIIDKFGQVVSAITPKTPLKVWDSQSETAYPCLGDQVCPGLIEGTNNLNTVTALTEVDPQLPGEYPLCPYIQLTPAINQNSRFNAEFVVPRLDSADTFLGWRVTDDWEQPVFAWVIINYADYGLQFFTGEGVFYVEMTLGGPTKTIKSPHWQPFTPPTNSSARISPQLIQLIENMTKERTGSTYLRSFWSMITAAVETMPFAPASYASYSTSIVGKPFALVNCGFSLELSLPPMTSQTTLPPPSVPGTPSEADILYSYKFPVKIGDRDRPFDGVVGFWDTDNTTTGLTQWEKLHSYFPPAGEIEDGDPRLGIEPKNFDNLSPYYIPPEGPLINGSFEQSHAEKLLVKTVVMDPYTAIHLYSPILPIKSLKLPDWTAQRALRKMSAFFRVGPILVTKDVPSTYNPAKRVSADEWVKKQNEYKANPETAAIRLPIAGAKGGLWSWLQPYAAEDQGGERRYNDLDVGEEDGRLRLDPGPYTMVEGFLQLMQPLKDDD